MTYTALIKVAPLTTLERVNDERWQAPRTMYDPGALMLLPGQHSAPVLVDHREERVVGRIRSLMKIEDTDRP